MPVTPAPPPGFDPDAPFDVKAGRRYPWTSVGDWVAMSGASDRACRLYWVFRMHVNRERGDDKVWPGQDELGALLGGVRRQTVAEAAKELVTLGAIDIETVRDTRNPMRRRNVYTVHEAPPEGYAGPKSLREWYDARRAAAGQPPVSQRHPLPTSAPAPVDRSAAASPVDNRVSAGRTVVRSSAPPDVQGVSAGRTVVRPSELPVVRPSEPRDVSSSAHEPQEEEPQGGRGPVRTEGHHARAREGQPPANRRQPAPPATGDDYRARSCRMCRLDVDGRTWVRVLPVDGAPVYTPLTVCDHETPLDAIEREREFLEQHAADAARAAAPQPITLAGPINRGPQPAIRRTTRGTDEDRERARRELAAVRARVEGDPDPMETPQAMEASG